MSASTEINQPGTQHDRALQRVKRRRDFTTHLFAYVLVNLLLWGIWTVAALTGHTSFPWPIWVTFGWGIGIAFNAWDVYFRRPITEDDVRREMERLGPPPVA